MEWGCEPGQPDSGPHAETPILYRLSAFVSWDLSRGSNIQVQTCLHRAYCVCVCVFKRNTIPSLVAK